MAFIDAFPRPRLGPDLRNSCERDGHNYVVLHGPYDKYSVPTAAIGARKLIENERYFTLICTKCGYAFEHVINNFIINGDQR